MSISRESFQQTMFHQLSTAFTNMPFNQALGLHLELLQSEHVSMRFLMKQELIGNFVQGILHGGVISSALDMAGGMVVMASIIDSHLDTSVDELTKIIGKCSTIDLHIHYMRPGKGEEFFVTASLEKHGAHISFTRMELRNQENILIASARGTYAY